MQLLITGGAGFIGSAVVRLALTRGFNVVNFDKLTYAANPDNLKGWDDREPYTFVEGDICDRSAVRAALDAHAPDAVMHLAAETHVDRSIDGPEAFIATNVVGTQVLLDECRHYFEGLSGDRKNRFRFHHVSTDEVYGSLGAEGKFTEQSPYRPNSPYSASKAGADHLVRAWSETYDLPILISNCSNNYGPFQFPEKLIPVVILAALDRRPIPVYGKGENIRDWLFVEDHADALLRILDRGKTGETYNVGGDCELTNIELVRHICALMDELAADGRPHANLIEFVADRPGHDFRYAIDAGKIARELNWRPSVSIEDGLRQTVAWYLENQSWWEAIRARGFETDRLGVLEKEEAAR